jgi:hypothetical protein
MTKPVIYVDWGIANSYEDRIELNKHLQFYPELHKQILEHELSHTNTEGFSKEDFALDLGPQKVSYWTLFKFMCVYPKTFTQFLPLRKSGDTIYYDINMSISWIAILGVIGLGLYFGFN